MKCLKDKLSFSCISPAVGCRGELVLSAACCVIYNDFVKWNPIMPHFCKKICFIQQFCSCYQFYHVDPLKIICNRYYQIISTLSNCSLQNLETVVKHLLWERFCPLPWQFISSLQNVVPGGFRRQLFLKYYTVLWKFEMMKLKQALDTSWIIIYHWLHHSQKSSLFCWQFSSMKSMSWQWVSVVCTQSSVFGFSLGWRPKFPGLSAERLERECHSGVARLTQQC